MKKAIMALLFGTTLILGACGGADENVEPPADAPIEEPGVDESAVDAEQVVNRACISCHGANLEGRGNFPPLDDVGARLSEEEILDIILNGKGAMPPEIIEGAEAEAVAEWLANKQ
ncbi:MAG TPA: c-type cytochrome [Planococcus sp. (in: firmicutes)]|nr:c-type cytochrome [Planococcus sp. (in: firmicutes)]